jgi:hypothetical protein
MGTFFGFSIEMSVVSHVRTPFFPYLLPTDSGFVSLVGKNNSLIQLHFLNLMANIKVRASWVQVRIGGISGERSARFKPSQQHDDGQGQIERLQSHRHTGTGLHSTSARLHGPNIGSDWHPLVPW